MAPAGGKTAQKRRFNGRKNCFFARVKMSDVVAEVRTENQPADAAALGSEPSVTEAFIAGIEPTPVTAKYKLGLVTVAMGMALLMAVYLVLILAGSYGVYYHLAHHSLL